MMQGSPYHSMEGINDLTEEILLIVQHSSLLKVKIVKIVLKYCPRV